MGKISKALNKYAKERGGDAAAEVQPPPRVPLNQVDYDALVNYDRFTGHLVQQDRKNGDIDGAAIERLRQEGIVQRLLDNELIYPSGKLTPKGDGGSRPPAAPGHCRAAHDRSRRLRARSCAGPGGDDPAGRHGR